MMTPKEQMEEFMRQDAELLARVHRENARGVKLRYHGLSDLMLQEGEWMEPSDLLHSSWLGEMQQCYRNALYLARREGFDYVEGLAWNGIFPVHHAWVADGPAVYEVTWPDVDPAIHAYVGLRIPWPVVEGVVFKRGYYGILDDWQNGWPALQQPWSIEALVEKYRTIERRC